MPLEKTGFQGVQKETSGMKWFKRGLSPNKISKYNLHERIY